MSAAAHEGRPGGSNREQRYSYPNKQGWSLLYREQRYSYPNKQVNADADRMRELPLLQRDGFSGGEASKLISRMLNPAPESVA